MSSTMRDPATKIRYVGGLPAPGTLPKMSRPVTRAPLP